MHKIFVLCFLSLLLPGFAASQAVLDESILPVIGDTTYVMEDNLPRYMEIQAPGQNLIWNFTNLSAPFAREEILFPVANASAGSANCKLEKGPNVEWYELTKGEFLLHSITGPEISALGNVHLNLKLETPIRLIYNNMTFGDRDVQSCIASQIIPKDSIDPLLIANDDNNLEEYKLQISYTVTTHVDAWGILLMPMVNYDVLRQHLHIESNSKLFAKRKDSGWIDVTESISQEKFGLLQPKEQDIYYFWSKDHSGFVARIDAEQIEVKKIAYKADSYANIKKSNQDLFGVYVYPNPSFGDVRFEFVNLPDRSFKLEVVNVLGKELWSRPIELPKDRVILADLTKLKRGTYFYSLVDETGKRIITRRMIIIKP